MSDLITRERALRNLSGLSPTAAEAMLLDALIAAVSRAAENLCRRTFTPCRHDELYAGTDRVELLVRHYPVISVERIAGGPVAVLRVTNAAAANQRAAVRVTDRGLLLQRVASAVTTTNELLFETYPTLTALADAVVALGNGWSASLANPDDAQRAAADLRALQGALSAKDRDAELLLHAEELSDYAVDAERGCLVRHPAGWGGGPGAWRVVYVAGYGPLPEDVQEACAQWVAALFWQSKRDPGLASESVVGAAARTALREPPGSVRTLLASYRSLRL